MAKTNLRTIKYPNIPVPIHQSKFSDSEIKHIRKTYKCSIEEAKLIAKEKFYGSDCPHGYESWKMYWSLFTIN